MENTTPPNVCKKLKRSEELRTIEGNGLINNLPDDCLLCVFSHLSAEDRLQLSRVCKRWFDFGPDIWRKASKADLTNLHKLKVKCSMIISLCGKSLVDLSVTVLGDSDVLRKAAQKCENLRKICIVFSSVFVFGTHSSLSQLFMRNKQIRRVKLDNVGTNFSAEHLLQLSEELVELELWGFKSSSGGLPTVWYKPCDSVLLRFTKLQRLVLNGFKIYKDDLKAIEFMRELKFLELYQNHDGSDYNIDRIAKLTTLEYLFVHQTRQATNRWCAELVRNNQSLKHLNLSGSLVGSGAMRELTKLSMLETLELRNLQPGSLSDNDPINFTSLKKFDSNAVKDVTVIPLLENSPNLEFMNISATRVGDITARTLDAAHHATRYRESIPLHVIVDDSIVADWRKVRRFSPLLTIEKSTTYFKRINVKR